jgi:L-ascorbate metabolism protein UlaG (beta-lactamase superfamily)
MQLTWLGHSCFRLEKDGFVAVIDPGIVAPANALDDADAVLITHQHADHFLPSLIAGRLATRPGLPVRTPRIRRSLLRRPAVAGRRLLPFRRPRPPLRRTLTINAEKRSIAGNPRTP